MFVMTWDEKLAMACTIPAAVKSVSRLLEQVSVVLAGRGWGGEWEGRAEAGGVLGWERAVQTLEGARDSGGGLCCILCMRTNKETYTQPSVHSDTATTVQPTGPVPKRIRQSLKPSPN